MIKKRGIVSLFLLLMIFSSFQKSAVEGFNRQWITLTQSAGAAEEAEAARRTVAYAREQKLTWAFEAQDRATSQPVPVGELNLARRRDDPGALDAEERNAPRPEGRGRVPMGAGRQSKRPDLDGRMTWRLPLRLLRLDVEAKLELVVDDPVGRQLLEEITRAVLQAPARAIDLQLALALGRAVFDLEGHGKLHRQALA